MRLFKYLQREHRDRFFETGSMRLGTLFEYRDTTRYGNVTGDALEGFHLTELSIPGGGEIDLASDTPEAQFINRIGPPNQPPSSVIFVMADGARIISHRSCPNLYIYSMTSQYDPAVMEQFGYDSCMQILDVPAFFSAVTRELRKTQSILQWGVVPVEYLSRHTAHSSPHTTHPAVMKDPEYAYQMEWRAFWRIEEPPVSALLLDSRRARYFAAVYEP